MPLFLLLAATGHFRASHSRIRLHPKVASVLDDLKPHNANIAEYVDNDYRNCAREDHKAARGKGK